MGVVSIPALEAAYLAAMRDAWRARDRFHGTLAESASKQSLAHEVWAAETRMHAAFAELKVACAEADAVDGKRDARPPCSCGGECGCHLPFPGDCTRGCSLPQSDVAGGP